jgi:hypothetical protein
MPTYERTAHAVTGYMPSSSAGGLESREALPDVLELRFRPDRDDILVRVRRKDVEEVRVGSAIGDQTGIQLILRDDHDVEVINRIRLAPGVVPFEDPLLTRLTREAIITSIFV